MAFELYLESSKVYASEQTIIEWLNGVALSYFVIHFDEEQNSVIFRLSFQVPLKYILIMIGSANPYKNANDIQRN